MILDILVGIFSLADFLVGLTVAVLSTQASMLGDLLAAPFNALADILINHAREIAIL